MIRRYVPTLLKIAPDRGIAEVIISKHRNGPTGTVKLLFESQFTQFRNLAAPNRM